MHHLEGGVLRGVLGASLRALVVVVVAVVVAVVSGMRPGYRYPRIVRIAALDLGTNSFHLLVADVQPDGHFETLVTEKAMIRLGDVVSR